jgi:hypothetical protein
MTQTHEHMDTKMEEEREPTAAELEALQRQPSCSPTRQSQRPIRRCPTCRQACVRRHRPTGNLELPDYVAIEMDHSRMELAGQVGMWNML